MKKKILLFLSLYSLALFSSHGVAVTLTLVPMSQEIRVGSTTSVDLNISDLGDYSAPSLGAFLTEIVFDDVALSFESVTYGDLLGSTEPSLFETDIVTTVTPGSVSLDEFSFLSDYELDSLQPDSFTLASLSFMATSAGTSLLEFGLIDLSDAIGFSILDPTLETASITVTPEHHTVPEPATYILMLSGLVGIMGLKCRRHKGS
ncbi:MAG: cohesin domain-containing protein [Candidatus Thiodiazotropha sp. 6PLUC5]